MRLEVVTAVKIQIMVFWGMTLYIMVQTFVRAAMTYAVVTGVEVTLSESYDQ